jgi:hypothetical protein
MIEKNEGVSLIGLQGGFTFVTHPLGNQSVCYDDEFMKKSDMI